jgi:hypothetical protein
MPVDIIFVEVKLRYRYGGLGTTKIPKTIVAWGRDPEIKLLTSLRSGSQLLTDVQL